MILDLNYEFPLTSTKDKRAALNFIGSRTFGVLAEDHAKLIKQEIENSRQNEIHLIKLLKSQTSFIESTLTSLKLAEKRFGNKFQQTNTILDKEFAPIENRNWYLAGELLGSGGFGSVSEFIGHSAILAERSLTCGEVCGNRREMVRW
uniref:Uncharacterized protein n=1 Tax=Megaselia scalaris TaxID=36166 RepID=T1GG18_MEGSC